jgi:glycine C-acetyltransferase
MTTHAALEERLAAFKGTGAALLFNSGYAANTGILQGLFDEKDLILSDELNHASIIDGCRLSRATRAVYRHKDYTHLRELLRDARQNKGIKGKILVVTDGVFSMDGDVAPLAEICELADRHRALVMVDDSHATGFMGRTGRGTPEHCGVQGRVDVLTTTFGKALGGASGGCIAARKPIVELLRQRSRPYLFSNTLPPVVAGATLRALELLSGSTALRDTLEANTRLFRERMTAAGFEIRPGVHPIVPILFTRFAPEDAPLAQRFARALLDEGVYVKGFFFPVVPRGQSRIRVQLSAAHRPEHVERAVAAFTKVGKALGVIAA